MIHNCKHLLIGILVLQIRNESAEDFRDLIKEWDKLCKQYMVEEEQTQSNDFTFAGSADDAIPATANKNVAEDEYEVERLVDICYSDLDGTSERGLKFKV